MFWTGQQFYGFYYHIKCCHPKYKKPETDFSAAPAIQFVIEPIICVINVHVAGGHSICSIHRKISSLSARCKEIRYHHLTTYADIMDWGSLSIIEQKFAIWNFTTPLHVSTQLSWCAFQLNLLLLLCRYHLNEAKADWIIYVTDVGQRQHFEMLFTVSIECHVLCFMKLYALQIDG